jgi:hypothetical protein
MDGIPGVLALVVNQLIDSSNMPKTEPGSCGCLLDTFHIHTPHHEIDISCQGRVFGIRFLNMDQYREPADDFVGNLFSIERGGDPAQGRNQGE